MSDTLRLIEECRSHTDNHGRHDCSACRWHKGTCMFFMVPSLWEADAIARLLNADTEPKE